MNANENKLSAAQRRMLDEHLRQRGINDPRVLAAMERVDREAFVPSDERTSAYDDRALAIACGQTISQPFTVAFMCQAAELMGSERVLEVGTGSGYGAAILSRLAREVHTIERLPSLAIAVEKRLRALGLGNISVHLGDGSRGWSAAAPYDAIIVTAGGPAIPRPLLDQLAEDGRLIIPLGPSLREQAMWRIGRRNNDFHQENLGPFAFVPLIGEWGWPDEADEVRPVAR